MIIFDSLTKKFGEKVAVDSLSFTVPKGALFGFLGPNGAGKTTTLRILMGLVRPTLGRALIDDCNVSTQSLLVRAKVGYLPDEVFLYDYLTAQQFLEFVAGVRKLDPKTTPSLIEHYLAFFDLASSAGDYIANFSFGMKKKLALASIVMHKPSTLILDEPFNGLDPQAAKDFKKFLVRTASEGTTVLFSSHVLEVVEKMVSHVGIIHNGAIQGSGKLDEVLEANGGSLEKAFFTLTKGH